jgi:hypothetical protein
MARIVEFDSELDGKTFKVKLRDAIQSARLNFLFGAGASAPALTVAGHIEAEIDAHLQAGETAEADLVASKFLASFRKTTNELQTATESGDVSDKLSEYRQFLEALETILVNRHNTLLLRQCTIFTTNYDVFTERASDFLPNLILNDGFDRRPSLTTAPKLRPEHFFDSTFHTGRRYDYRVELPSINLVKLHGSLTWRPDVDGFYFQEWNTDDIETSILLEAFDDIVNSAGVVLPNLNKYRTTLLESVYYEQLRIFANELEIENCLLFAFGFSFSDIHIREILLRSLRNPTLWLVIPCYKMSEVSKMQKLFSGFLNVTILKPSKDDQFDFKWLIGLLTNGVED